MQVHERNVTRCLWFTDPTKPNKVNGNLSWLSNNAVTPMYARYLTRTVTSVYSVCDPENQLYLQNSIFTIKHTEINSGC